MRLLRRSVLALLSASAIACSTEMAPDADAGIDGSIDASRADGGASDAGHDAAATDAFAPPDVMGPEDAFALDAFTGDAFADDAFVSDAGPCATVTCTAADECHDAGTCDPATGTCSSPSRADGTACNGGANVCVGGACTGCTTDAQCQTGGMTNGRCDPTHACVCTASTCPALGATCGSVPGGCGALVPCDDTIRDGTETDVDCGGATRTCATRCGQGRRCSVGSDCASGFCVDGVCCDGACTGTCRACSAAAKGGGVDGVCGAVLVGHTDPHARCFALPSTTCGETGTCDGAGACALWPAGTTCGTASCSGTTMTNAPRCDGSGSCSPPTTTSCTPYACAGVACGTSCSVASQTGCAPADYCAGSGASGICVAKLGTGAVCTGDFQCTSGSCATGHCT
jgi:hypothetical protein